MPIKKKRSENIDKAVAQATNFEITIADLARRSERRAWWVAGASAILTLVLAGGYFYMLPLKEKVPYLILADAYTGTSSLTRLTDDVTEKRLSASEAINRSNIAHFILARESYDAAITNLRDWTTVLTMSSASLAREYTYLYSASNPKNPAAIYGRSNAIRVKIHSIVLIGGGNGAPPKGATVRFQRSLYNVASGSTQPLDNKIATLEFVYKPNLVMDDQRRVENPLGFQVTSYRVDNDFAPSPPEETPVPVNRAPDPTTSAGDSAAGTPTAVPDATAPPTPAAATAAPGTAGLARGGVQ